MHTRRVAICAAQTRRLRCAWAFMQEESRRAVSSETFGLLCYYRAWLSAITEFWFSVDIRGNPKHVDFFVMQEESRRAVSSTTLRLLCKTVLSSKRTDLSLRRLCFCHFRRGQGLIQLFSACLLQ